MNISLKVPNANLSIQINNGMLLLTQWGLYVLPQLNSYLI